MITHILLDADGVVLKPHEYFSKTYAEQYGLEMGIIDSFFKEKFLLAYLDKVI